LWDWNGAHRDLDRALALNSRSAEVLGVYAGLLAKLGRAKEAIAIQRKVVEINPLDADAWSDLCAFLTTDGQLREAREAYARTQEISPGNEEAAGRLGAIDLLDGHATEALIAMEKIPRTADRLLGVAIAQHDLGHAGESEEALRQLASMVDGPEGNIAYQIASVHAWRGERNEAFAWLDRAFARHDIALRLVKVDPFLRNLHGDPRLIAFLKKMNLPPD
jgi:serine/threonine-protein kinase